MEIRIITRSNVLPIFIDAVKRLLCAKTFLLMHGPLLSIILYGVIAYTISGNVGMSVSIPGSTIIVMLIFSISYAFGVFGLRSDRLRTAAARHVVRMYLWLLGAGVISVAIHALSSLTAGNHTPGATEQHVMQSLHIFIMTCIAIGSAYSQISDMCDVVFYSTPVRLVLLLFRTHTALAVATMLPTLLFPMALVLPEIIVVSLFVPIYAAIVARYWLYALAGDNGKLPARKKAAQFKPVTAH